MTLEDLMNEVTIAAMADGDAVLSYELRVYVAGTGLSDLVAGIASVDHEHKAVLLEVED